MTRFGLYFVIQVKLRLQVIHIKFNRMFFNLEAIVELNMLNLYRRYVITSRGFP